MEKTKDTSEKNIVYYCQKCKLIPKLKYIDGPEVKIEVTCEKCNEPAKVYELKEINKEIASLTPYEAKKHSCQQEGCTNEANRFCESHNIYLCKKCSDEKHGFCAWDSEKSGIFGGSNSNKLKTCEKNIKEGFEKLHHQINKNEKKLNTISRINKIYKTKI